MVAVPSPGGIPLGKLSSQNPLYEDLTRRRSLREYRRGDEPRRINWKASIRNFAAAGEGGLPGGPPPLLVNEYEAAISCPLVVFLNLDPYEYALPKRELWFERAIEAAAALCLLASRDRQDLGIILYQPWEKTAGPCALIKPGPFTLLPILERLAAVKRPRRPGGEGPAGEDGGAAAPRGSTRALLAQGKGLPYGTRLVYAGPELPEEDYGALISLGAWRISLEFLVLDERRLGPLAPGGAPRYQMREGGYDIL
jgi:hypothetical protein